MVRVGWKTATECSRLSPRSYFFSFLDQSEVMFSIGVSNLGDTPFRHLRQLGLFEPLLCGCDIALVQGKQSTLIIIAAGGVTDSAEYLLPLVVGLKDIENQLAPAHESDGTRRNQLKNLERTIETQGNQTRWMFKSGFFLTQGRILSNVFAHHASEQFPSFLVIALEDQLLISHVLHMRLLGRFDIRV
jgi:hypothetical protein